MRGYRGEALRIEGGARTITCGVDDQHWIAIEGAGEPRRVVELPRWASGIGGMELVASADERHVALFLYSGQSSLGYEVFAVGDALSHAGGLAELRGVGSAPVFSPRATWLAMLTDRDRWLRGGGAHFEDVQDDDADERVIVDWATLHLQRLPGAAVASVAVGVELPRSTDLELVLGWRPYDAIRFAGEDALVLSLPWGDELTVALPVEGPLTTRLPSGQTR
jgi:hypothetical protein